MKLTAPNDPGWERMVDHVYNCHGWCRIEDLSGDCELGIYMASFNDDYRIIFEYNDGDLELMLTKDQIKTFEEAGKDALFSTTCEIMVFFNRYLEEKEPDFYSTCLLKGEENAG